MTLRQRGSPRSAAKIKEEDDGFVVGTPKRTNTKRRNSTAKDSPKKTASGERRKTCDRWTKREKALLTEAISKFGERSWNDIASYVGTKNSDQCNQHWHRVLNPAISKKPWSPEEDASLFARVYEFGESSWKKVSEGIDGRTDIQCRHRWIMLKKQTEKRANAANSRTNPANKRNQSEDSPIPDETKPKRTRHPRKKSAVVQDLSMLDMFQQDYLQQRLLQYLHPDVPQLQTQPLLPPLQLQSDSGSEEEFEMEEEGADSDVGETSDSDSSPTNKAVKQEAMSSVSLPVAVAETPSFSTIVKTEDQHLYHQQQIRFHSQARQHTQHRDQDLSIEAPSKQQRGGENQGDTLLEKALADWNSMFCESDTSSCTSSVGDDSCASSPRSSRDLVGFWTDLNTGVGFDEDNSNNPAFIAPQQMCTAPQKPMASMPVAPATVASTVRVDTSLITNFDTYPSDEDEEFSAFSRSKRLRPHQQAAYLYF